MLLAAIDIGSNAVRLLFSNVIERNGIQVADKASLVRIPVRLGEDVFTHGAITPLKEENLLKTLSAFKLLIEVYKPVAYRACATAAMREASNSQHVIQRIEKETGLRVKVIDGIEEAAIISAVDNLNLGKQYKYKMYIDVGGGSTEISLMLDRVVVRSESFRIGTIRIREHLIDDQEWQRMKEWLKPLKEEKGKIFCVGSGGNINKIAKIYSKSEQGVITFGELEQAYNDLSKVSDDYRIAELGMRPDRADVIVPAAEIFLKVMKWGNIEFASVPKIGLPDGLVHLLYREIMLGKTS